MWAVRAVAAVAAGAAVVTACRLRVQYERRGTHHVLPRGHIATHVQYGRQPHRYRDDTGDSDDDNARPLWGGVTRDPILCCWLGRTMPNESAPLLPFMEEAVKSTETLTEVFGSGDKDMAARAARRVVGVMWLDGSAKVTTQKHNLSFDLKDIYARSRFSYHKACGASTRPGARNPAGSR